MVTHVRTQIGRNENRIMLWTLAMLIVCAVMAYTAYAGYQNSIRNIPSNTSTQTIKQ